MYLPLIPWEEIRHLPLPDLAMRLLTKKSSRDDTNIHSTFKALEAALRDTPQDDGDQLLGRISDAWAWLESHALVGPSIGGAPAVSQRVTSLGREMIADPKAVARIWAADRLAGDLASQLGPARSIFALGEYETASFAAMKAVEVEVRRISGLSHELVGVKLARTAFAPVGGPLSDPEAEGGERQAMADLFAGAMGAFKNPVSHRAVQFDDAVEAAEIVQLADLLLRIVRRSDLRIEKEKNAR